MAKGFFATHGGVPPPQRPNSRTEVSHLFPLLEIQAKSIPCVEGLFDAGNSRDHWSVWRNLRKCIENCIETKNFLDTEPEQRAYKKLCRIFSYLKSGGIILFVSYHIIHNLYILAFDLCTIFVQLRCWMTLYMSHKAQLIFGYDAEVGQNIG